MGVCLWDLSRGQRTGDGRFDGEAFLGGLLIFFLGGVGEGKRRLQVTFRMVCFFAGRHEFPNSPFYVIYYILNSGGFTSPRRPGQRT